MSSNDRRLLVYDIDTTTDEGRKRLGRIGRLCCGFGTRVQKSVFEVVVPAHELARLVAALNELIDADTDTVRIYRLRPGPADIVALGRATPPSTDDLLIL